MAQSIRILDISDGFEAIIAAIDADGGVIVRNFISQDLCGRIKQELQDHADNWKAGRPGTDFVAAFAGAQTKRFTGLAARAPSFAEVIDHDLLHAWAQHGFKTDYWMNTGQAMIVGPGSTNQPLHRDHGVWPLADLLGRDGPEATQSIMLAVTDFTADNGATRAVPGSHLWEDYTVEAAPEDAAQAIMPAGSAFLYTGKVLHGAGGNRTADQWRFGIHLSFVRADLRPEEANCLTVPWSIAQNYSERVQHMLGFYSGRPVTEATPTIWMADFLELRDQLQPPARHEYAPAGPSFNPEATTAQMVTNQISRSEPA